MQSGNYKKSEKYFEISQKYIPGGVNSPVRAARAVHRDPVFIKSASGSKIFDVDGNEYIDYVCSWGPAILGHAHPYVLKKVKKAIKKGLSFGAPTKKEYILAEMINEAMPVMEQVRLVNSGTEATMSAIRLARGYTNKDLILKFTGCYHGHSDGLLVKAGSGVLTEAISSSGGVPDDYAKNTIVAEFNDIDSVNALFEKYHGKIAAVIVEPVAANMGVILPDKGFLEFLREITRKNSALLIFDEVITGFRLAKGGACEYFGIEPDLITVGKIVGGGMPLAAYGGKKEIMSYISPLGDVYQAGTLSGNPVATAAGIATLEVLFENPDIYKRIDENTKLLADGIENIMNTNEKRVHINRIGSLMSVFFTSQNVKSYKDVLTCDLDKYARYYSFLRENGIYIAPSQFEAVFVSDAHSIEDIKNTLSIIAGFGGK
ncbi:glutamate-1-semialdehyde-2,1-aminomutase [Lachnospiraceae oral taxon 107 str. F0167]|jgi:glutamate-1-semialdehyde-2,1-aminomutase|nr:glutamate-1-semialdehyde-2,1-aminomutase [Lachnospiraceae oral taxon 107 str. F0167]RKW36913.1 MAG: glutamate-1-semialdehyde-2,1-aminomutase [Lachnospiraceae bacterium]